MSGSRFRVAVFRLAALGVCAAAAAGDTPQVQAQLGAGEVYSGESVEYQVALRNVKNAAPPDMTAFNADFDVAAAGDQTLNQSSTFIVNGRMSRQEIYGHLYAYRLTPKRAGTLTVPAPTATVDGRTVTGPALSLRVIAPEKQDFVVAELAVKPARAFPTQPFDVTLRIFVKPLPDVPNRDPLAPLKPPPVIQINWENPPEGLAAGERNAWLQKYLAPGEQGFSINGITARSNNIFAMMDGPRTAAFNLAAGREKRAGLDGKPIEYFAYELKRTFTGKQAGAYSFGATVKGTFVGGVAGRRYTGRAVFAVAPSQSVDVRSVPAPRPPSFCGGVGSYGVTATASPAALRVGDPLTLTLSIEAKGGGSSLDMLSAPDLSANAALAESFEVLDRAPTGEVKGNQKQFVYGLRPKKISPGIPPLTVTTFSPDTERFVDLTTRPIALRITETTQLNAGELVGKLSGNQAHELRSRQEGIFQNITDVAELGDQSVRPIAYVIATAALWVLYGGMSLWVQSRRRRAGDTAWQRRQRAMAGARQRLAESRAAEQAGQKADALRALRDALVELIADMRNCAAAGMTAQEAAAALASAGVSSETATGTVRALQEIEALEYGSAATLDCTALRTTVEELLPRLHKELGSRT